MVAEPCVIFFTGSQSALIACITLLQRTSVLAHIPFLSNGFSSEYQTIFLIVEPDKFESVEHPLDRHRPILEETAAILSNTKHKYKDIHFAYSISSLRIAAYTSLILCNSVTNTSFCLSLYRCSYLVWPPWHILLNDQYNPPEPYSCPSGISIGSVGIGSILYFLIKFCRDSTSFSLHDSYVSISLLVGIANVFLPFLGRSTITINCSSIFC